MKRVYNVAINATMTIWERNETGMPPLIRDHLGRDETPAPTPGILVSDYYNLPYGYSCYRPGGTKDWLIMFTLSGQGVVMDGDQPIASGPGDIILIPPNTPQIYYTSEDSVWEKIWCHFLPRPSWTDWLALPDTQRTVIRLPIEDRFHRENIESAFRRLLKYNRYHYNSYWEELSLNALEEVLLLTLYHATGHSRKFDSRVREVLNHLTDHYAEECHIEDLAKMVCLSPSRLAHLFKEQVGETIIDVLNEFRLKQAERLLKFSSRQITEIAYDVGFNSPDYFTRKFKERYLVSPNQFRRQFKGEGEEHR